MSLASSRFTILGVEIARSSATGVVGRGRAPDGILRCPAARREFRRFRCRNNPVNKITPRALDKSHPAVPAPPTYARHQGGEGWAVARPADPPRPIQVQHAETA